MNPFNALGGPDHSSEDIRANWSDYWLNFENGKTPSSMILHKDFIHLIPPGSTVLDVGCGYGRVTEELARQGFNPTGIDINPKELSTASNNAKKLGLNIQYVQSEGTTIPFGNDTFDCAILLGTLGAMDSTSRELLARDSYRILKPGGRLYVAEFAKKSGEPERESRYSQDANLTGEMGSNIVRDKAGDVLYIAKHFIPEELSNILVKAGLVDIQLRNELITKKNVRDSGIEQRHHISVWGTKP